MTAFDHLHCQPPCGGIVRQSHEQLWHPSMRQGLCWGSAITVRDCWQTQLRICTLQGKSTERIIRTLTTPPPHQIYILWPCLVRALLRNYNNWELIMLGHQKNQSVAFRKTHLWTFSLKMRNSEQSVITSVNQSFWDKQTTCYTNTLCISLIMALGWNTLFSLAVFGHVLCIFLLSLLATTTLSLFSTSPGVAYFIHFTCTTSLWDFCRQWIMTELIHTNWLA